MKLLLSLVVSCAYSQTCQYQMVSAPSGAVQVYQNGLLLRQVADYSYIRPAGLLPRINPLKWAAGDKFTVVYPHRLSLSTTVGSVTFPYFAYQTWQEIWDCPGTAAAITTLDAVEKCSGVVPLSAPGLHPPWINTFQYSKDDQVNLGASVYLSLRSLNVGFSPDISPDWWRQVVSDCGGLMRAKITQQSGLKLVITGTSATFSNGNWTTIE